MPREECQKMCQKLIFCHPYSIKAHNSRFTVATNVKESSPGDSKQGRPANSQAFATKLSEKLPKRVARVIWSKWSSGRGGNARQCNERQASK